MGFLNKKIIDFGPKIFGVDFSDLSVKVMKLDREGKKEKIVSFASAEIPAGAMDEGKIINPDACASAIRQAVKKAGPKKIRSKNIICSIPESKAFIRIISLPKMEEEEMVEAVKWEMEANIPLSLDQVYFDWQIIENDNKGKKSILTVAVAKEVVDSIIAVLKKAGLEAYGLEIESIATARSLIAQSEEKTGADALIVDLGARRTSFIMIVNSAPYFTSSVPFSSESITEAIKKSLNLGDKEAEQAKVSYGIESQKEDNPIFSATKSLLENLSQEIEKNLDFYASLSKENPKIERVILCGGGANLKGLVAFLAKRLGMQVEIGNPWVNLRLGKKLPPIKQDESLRYATVVGLALGGINYEDD